MHFGENVFIEAFSRFDTSLVKKSLMMPIWFSKEPAIPFMAKIEKSGIPYVRDILSLNGNYLSQTELQQK